MAVTPVFAIKETDSIEATTVFNDINSSDWFYESVMNMYESGIVGGYGDGRFGPNDNITHAQILSILARLAEIDTSKYKDGTSWYSNVAGWAKLNLSSLPSNLSEPATRFDISKYIVDIFKLDSTVRTFENSPFSDTNDKNALTLYKYGITVGVPTGDGEVKFNGDNKVTRAQACVMLDRLLEVDKPVWEIDIRNEVKAYYNNSLDYSYCDKIKEPNGSLTTDNFVNAWMYAMYTGYGEVTIEPDVPLNIDEVVEIRLEIIDAWYLARNKLLAYSSFYDDISVGSSLNASPGDSERYRCTFTLRCKNKEQNIDTIKNKISDFEYQCAQIIDEMYTTGQLKTDMSIKDKAKVLYEYLDYRLQYDSTYQNSGVYETLRDNTGTCNGYTGIYNHLCNLAGVPMEAVSGYGNDIRHIWSKIKINGVTYHTDVTWGDPIPDRPNYSNLKWFWKTFNEFGMHTIDKYSKV